MHCIVDADLGVLWIESEQILHLKVGCPNFSPGRGSVIYPNYPFLECVQFLERVQFLEQGTSSF